MKRLVLGIVALLAAPLLWSQTDLAIAMQWLQETNPTVWQADLSTNPVAFLRWDAAPGLSGASPLQKAEVLIGTIAPALGLKPGSFTFQPIAERRDVAGNYHITFQYFHEGVPVFDGHLNVHFDVAQQLHGLDGLLLKDIDSASPNITPEEAVAQGISWVRKQYGEEVVSGIEVEEETLCWYGEGILHRQAAPEKLAYSLALTNREAIREQLIIDAQSGQVITHFPGVCDLVHRELYSGTLDSNPIWEDGDVFPGALSPWQQTQIHTTEEVFYFFRNAFDYRSYDDADSDMRMVDQATFLDCPNANWNGYSTNYCNSISTDDVVGHEWAHAYTEYTNQLLYAWQAGAINEAYSDIWGETIDILNSPAGENPLRGDCDSGNRWMIAEEATALGGPIRDMWNPNCYDNPGKVSDSQYKCDTDDFGGVHSNSGVISHAYALLVDGGQYNGHTIDGIGLSKAAHLFWHAQKHYLSRTSDFPVLADALTAAYLDLRSVPLAELSLAEDHTPTYQYLEETDSLNLQRVIEAVELRLRPDCENFLSVLDPETPQICLANGEVLTPFFTEDFETGTDGWTLSAHPENPASWVPRHWTLRTDLPDDRSGTGAYAWSPAVGNCDTAPNNGGLRLKTPLIEIPGDVEGDIYLVFDHYFSLEDGMDGGNVKLQQNGGGWLLIPPIAFLHNGYNDILPNSSITDNPLAGNRVWTGSDVGSTTGSWGTTQINLSVLGVEAGENIRLRWELGTDGCDGWDGWYVDDIHVGGCALAALPVEWLHFNAIALTERPMVRLDWQTTAEENNQGFHVERSMDGRTFSDIGFVAAATTSLEAVLNYEFIDQDLPLHTTTLYYRLRQTDLDGEFSYSPIRSVTRAGEYDWQILPNPAQNSCNISWPDAPFEQATVSLHQLQGRELARVSAWNPTMPLSMDVTAYPSGVYLLKIQAGKLLDTRRLVIQ